MKKKILLIICTILSLFTLGSCVKTVKDYYIYTIEPSMNSFTIGKPEKGIIVSAQICNFHAKHLMTVETSVISVNVGYTYSIYDYETNERDYESIKYDGNVEECDLYLEIEDDKYLLSHIDNFMNDSYYGYTFSKLGNGYDHVLHKSYLNDIDDDIFRGSCHEFYNVPRNVFKNVFSKKIGVLYFNLYGDDLNDDEPYGLLAQDIMYYYIDKDGLICVSPDNEFYYEKFYSHKELANKHYEYLKIKQNKLLEV